MIKSKIIERGKSYILPLEGLIISGIDLQHFLGIELKTENSNNPIIVIDIFADFTLNRFNQSKLLDPNNIETAKIILDLIDLKIKQSECSNTGDLYITLEDNTEITIPDSNFENWIIKIIRQERIKNSWVIGGVGSTTFFDPN